MAYAPYRDFPGLVEATGRTVFQVLDVTVASVDAYRVRRALAACDGVGVVRCEPLRHPGAACRDARPRVRLLVRLPASGYAGVIRCVLACVSDGEIGQRVEWRTHLRRRGLGHGG